MPKLKVEKTITIDASPASVYRFVSNLGNWRPWNPWLVTEPEAVVEVTPDGKSYTWEGKRTGKGSMKVASETQGQSIDLELTILTPYKSRSKVGFRFAPEGEGTRVTWTMDGSLPFFLFFLRTTMTELIGMDYTRGLSMLKDFVETGSVPAELELAGETRYGGCTYVGITTECATDELRSKMADDFIKLNLWAKETSTQLSDYGLCVYHEWEVATGRCRYTTAVPVDEAPLHLPEGFESGSVPSLTVYQVRHRGVSRHLGNAWSTLMQMARGKEIRVSKEYPPFERYVTMPGEVAEEKQEVLVCFPVRR